MGIFSKFFKKSQKSEPSKNDKKDEINNRSINYGEMIGQKPGYFREDGEWEIKRKCTPEYHFGTDSIIGGCGEVALVSEYDLQVHCEIYQWQCERCGYCHAIPASQIPEEVKKRIRYRTELKEKKDPVIIDFREYKQKRSKRGDAKKSNV